MKKHDFSERAFLNKKGHHSTAAIIATIEDSIHGDGFWGTYKISDCSRTIEIAIDLGNLNDLDNTIYKLNKIISVTEKYKEAIINLRPIVKEINKKEKLKKESSEENN